MFTVSDFERTRHVYCGWLWETMFTMFKLWLCGSKRVQAHMRPAAIIGASGGFAGLALQLLRDAAYGSVADISPSLATVLPDCPDLRSEEFFGLDLKSLVVGVLLGLALGPLLECLVLLRQLWALQLRSYLQRRPTYRLLAWATLRLERFEPRSRRWGWEWWGWRRGLRRVRSAVSQRWWGTQPLPAPGTWLWARQEDRVCVERLHQEDPLPVPLIPRTQTAGQSGQERQGASCCALCVVSSWALQAETVWGCNLGST